MPNPFIKNFLFQSFYPIEIVKARKQYVWDSSGRKYVDFNTGNGIGFLGHGNPLVLRRVKEALSSVYIVPPSFKTKLKEMAVEYLSRISPDHLSRAALLNTGSEAVELALKLLFKYRGKDKKIVSFSNSFHGRTLGALSLTNSNPLYHRDFPTLSNTLRLPYNDVNALEELQFKDIAGVIVEVIQGEGGVVPAKEEFLKALYEKCQSNDVPLVIDEIQTGFGRTGRLWAYMHYNVQPDVLLAGKSIGGGLPVSVVFAREDIAAKLEAYEHGSTFGFNPLSAAAVAGAVEAYFKFSVETKASERGEILYYKLKSKLNNDAVNAIRGKGLMVGISQSYPINLVFSCMLKKGVVVSRAGGNTVRLLPPFLITEGDIDFLARALNECWEELDGKGAAEENTPRIASDTLPIGYGAKGS